MGQTLTKRVRRTNDLFWLDKRHSSFRSIPASSPARSSPRFAQPCLGERQQAGEARCPGGLAALALDQVLADLDLDIWQGAVLAMHRHGVVARLGDRVGGVV